MIKNPYGEKEGAGMPVMCTCLALQRHLVSVQLPIRGYLSECRWRALKSVVGLSVVEVEWGGIDLRSDHLVWYSRRSRSVDHFVPLRLGSVVRCPREGRVYHL